MNNNNHIKKTIESIILSLCQTTDYKAQVAAETIFMTLIEEGMIQRNDNVSISEDKGQEEQQE